MRIPTAAGTLVLDESCGDCATCDRTGGMLQIEVLADGDSCGAIRICGTCVAKSLAIHLGRAHIDRGGRVEDLAR